MKKLLLMLLFIPSVLEGQTVRADRFTLATGPCTMRSGSGAPGVGLGVLCDTYLDTATGVLYLRQAAGWVVSGLSGTGTTDTIAKWTSSSVLGNSVLTESGATLNVGAHLLPLTTDTYDIGSPLKLWNQGYLAQLNAILFALETQTLFGGYSTIGYNAGSFAAAVTSGATTINFGTAMTTGHFVLTRGHDTSGTATAEYFQVGSVVSGTTYNVTRNLSGLGAKNWPQGMPFLVLGTTGTGRIDLFAYDGKPRIQFVEQGATYNTQTLRALLGNLNGHYGYATDVHGAVFGTASGARITVEPTNGIRIYGSDNDQKVTIDLSGNATFDGQITVGTGRNVLRNSECRVGTEDWLVTTNSGFTATIVGPSFSPWRLNDVDNTCYTHTASGTPGAGTVTDAYLNGQLIPVEVGKRYELSTYMGLHRVASGEVIIQWLNAAGSVFSSSSGSNQCTTASPGGVDLASWCRSGLIATAPALAVTARAVLRVTHNGTEALPYMFFVRSFFGEAKTEQEDLTEWGPAGMTEITGGMIRTDAIIARHITAATITGSHIAAGTIAAGNIVSGTITATQIAAGTITATQIAANTITGNEIAAIQLSAISADLGTITAGSITGGTIDGATINAGSGDEVVLNSSGITLTAGNAANNKVKWSDSNAVFSDSNSLQLSGLAGGNLLIRSNANVTIEAGLDGSGIVSLTGSGHWVESPGIRFTTMSGLGTNRFVCHDNDGDVYSSATTCDGSAPAPEALALREQVNRLEQEVTALRALVNTASPGALAVIRRQAEPRKPNAHPQ